MNNEKLFKKITPEDAQKVRIQWWGEYSTAVPRLVHDTTGCVMVRVLDYTSML